MVQSGRGWTYSPYRRYGQHRGGNNFIRELPIIAKAMARGAFNAVGKDLLKLGLDVGKQVITRKNNLKTATLNALKKEGKTLLRKGTMGAINAAKKKAGAGQVSKAKNKKGGRKNQKLTNISASTQKRIIRNQLIGV